MSAILTLQDLSVVIEHKRLLHQINLSIPARGISALMGPGGAGKSTLVRTLSGLHDTLPNVQISGLCSYQGAALSPSNRPALVSQRLVALHAPAHELLANALPDRASLTKLEQRQRFIQAAASLGAQDLAEQLDTDYLDLSSTHRRRLAILAEYLRAPALLLVDEPTAGLSDHDSALILAMLDAIAQHSAVVFVTHHQAQARAHSVQTSLLVQGQLVETAPTQEFFDAPRSEPARAYVRSGYCLLPAGAAHHPDVELPPEEPALAEELPAEDPDAPPPRPFPAIDRVPSPRHDAPSEAVGPRGFRWLVPGRLGGTPQPGLFVPLQQDLDALRRVGVTTIVTLLEDPLTLEGFHHIWLPIPDMHPPTFNEACKLASKLSILLAQGECIAVHCKAGIGRTGTILAAQLIWGGMSAPDAITAARQADPRWIQSEAQERFLADFADKLHACPPHS